MKPKCEDESPESIVDPLSGPGAPKTAINFSCGGPLGHDGPHMAQFRWTDDGWTSPISLNDEIVAYE